MTTEPGAAVVTGVLDSRIGNHSTALTYLTDAAQMQGRPRNATSLSQMLGPHTAVREVASFRQQVSAAGFAA